MLYRVYSVSSFIFEKRGPFLQQPEFPDVDDVLVSQEFDVRYTLTNGWGRHVREKYRPEAYELSIDDVHVLMDSGGDMIVACDNAPHHPGGRTFPHHKHRYPKDRFRPTEFSGRFEDFLEEVLWEMTRNPLR
jgi:hypothetical protein